MRKSRDNKRLDGEADAKGRREPYIRGELHKSEDADIGMRKNGAEQAPRGNGGTGASGQPLANALRDEDIPLGHGTTQPGKELLSASGLIEATVRDLRGRKLGEIEDFILDLSAGEIEYVVFSFGGLFGLGNKLCAVSPQLLELDEEKKCLRLGYDKERVGNAPEFDKYNWRHLSWTANPSRIYILRNKRRKAMKQDRPHNMYTLKR